MSISRRTFIGAAAATAVARGSVRSSPVSVSESPDKDRFDPWIEVDIRALRRNVAEVGRLGGGRPVLAVVKNNAYGLGLEPTVEALQSEPSISGFGVVTAEAALALRAGSVGKPVLLMGLAAGETAVELASGNVQLSLYNEEGVDSGRNASRRLNRPIEVQLYLDTGMGRMGRSFREALPWIASIAADDAFRIRGTYMAFTEQTDFDREQLRRFEALTRRAEAGGIDLGVRHASSSNGLFHLPEARLDMVRPGIALYGSYPSRPDQERALAALQSAFRLRARVVRVMRLEKGDTVSYGRRYTASAPTWIATIPAGHADGYPRTAVDGAKILIGERLYPVIGAVSASHTIVEVGPEPAVAVGDTATLLGPDDEAIQPNTVAGASGVSVYDLLMHLNPTLPRYFT